MTLLQVDGLVKHFPVRRGVVDLLTGQPRQAVRAVDGVSLDIGAAETLGLVGESGCGKSTVGRSIVRLETATAGRIQLGELDITGMDRSDMRSVRRDVQFVFQDPFASLNPDDGSAGCGGTASELWCQRSRGTPRTGR